MIKLTRLNRVPLIVNSDLIEHIDMTPDTVVTLTNGQKIMVLESAEEVVDRVVQFRQRVGCSMLTHAGSSQPAQSDSAYITRPAAHGR